MKRRIPYAVANYEKIVRENYYFVDKTRFIHELEKYEIPVFLRPRRFGKSLWCSILECYYDINRKARFEELFGNTDIGRNPTEAHNRHLVMRFDFSKVEVKPDIAYIERSFNHIASLAISEFTTAYSQFADFGAFDNVQMLMPAAYGTWSRRGDWRVWMPRHLSLHFVALLTATLTWLRLNDMLIR